MLKYYLEKLNSYWFLKCCLCYLFFLLTKCVIIKIILSCEPFLGEHESTVVRGVYFVVTARSVNKDFTEELILKWI